MEQGISADHITGYILFNNQEIRKSTKRRKKLFDYWPDSPFNMAEEEESLWKAVILQAIVDVTTQHSHTDSARSRLDALRWLTSNNPDFLDVCLRACLNPNQVRVMAKKAIANPGVWRVAASKSLRYLERRAMRARKRFQRAEKEAPPAPQGALIISFKQ